MALFVVLEDFFSGRVRIGEGQIIDDRLYNLPELERNGLAVAPVVPGVQVAIDRYLKQRNLNIQREIIRYGDLLPILLRSNAGASMIGTLTGDTVEDRLGGGASARKHNEAVTGAKDGANLVFTAPAYFIDGEEVLKINGVDQEPGVGCDYVTSESGGLGTGYDTFTLRAPLIATDSILLDYDPA